MSINKNKNKTNNKNIENKNCINKNDEKELKNQITKIVNST
jgi:hypothetical protein